jgi:hypothetical protein
MELGLILSPNCCGRAATWRAADAAPSIASPRRLGVVAGQAHRPAIGHV